MADLALSDLDDALAMLERLANTQGREIIDALRGNGDRHALALRYAKLPYNSKVVAGSGSALEGYNVLTSDEDERPVRGESLRGEADPPGCVFRALQKRSALCGVLQKDPAFCAANADRRSATLRPFFRDPNARWAATA